MAQPDHSGSSMLALYPPPEVAKALAVDGGLDPADMHVTIAYTGDAADVDRKQLRKAARKLADRPPFTATISGHARFTGGDQDAIVALVDAPELEQLRADARKQLAKRGIDIPSEHGFCAHLTIKYVGKDDPSPVGRLTPRKVPFDAVTAAHGTNRKTHPFDTTIQPAAIEAYATGWVLSGGPMTDRVRAGAGVAVRMAVEHAHDPGILEATLQIGKLTGTWALFFHRREQLTSQQTKLIIAVLAAIIAGLPVTTLVDRLRAEAGAGVYAADYLKTLTTQAAGGLLAGIYAHDAHNQLQDAVEDALRSAMAEGKAGALALNAEKHGVDGFDFAKAYQAIYDQLEHLPDLPLMAQQWVQDMIGGASRQVGALLARMFDADATRQEMLDGLTAALDVTADGSVTNRAVAAFLNQAMAQAMSQASLDLYQSEGAAEAWYVTAGDGRVCEGCDDDEGGSPYPVADCPVPGWHGGCRCVITVDDPAPFQALAALIG